jgi:hypothetical protein
MLGCFDTTTNLRKTSHPRCRTKQKATQTAWQRMAEQLPTMTIVYHNVLPRTLGGYAILPFGDPTHPVSPQMWQTQQRGYGHYLSPTPHNFYKLSTTQHPPLLKQKHPLQKIIKIHTINVKYLTYTYKKIPALRRDNVVRPTGE